jgi:hypothetical protein
MHTTANKEFEAGPMPDHGPHCTREQRVHFAQELHQISIYLAAEFARS